MAIRGMGIVLHAKYEGYRYDTAGGGTVLAVRHRSSVQVHGRAEA